MHFNFHFVFCAITERSGHTGYVTMSTYTASSCTRVHHATSQTPPAFWLLRKIRNIIYQSCPSFGLPLARGMSQVHGSKGPL